MEQTVFLMDSERTPLVGQQPGSRVKDDQTPAGISKFHCCLVSTLLPILIATVVITFSIMSNHNSDPIVPKERVIGNAQLGKTPTGPKKPSEPISIPVIVETGTVTARLGDADPTEQWSGNFPISIPLTLLSDLTWNATVTSSTADDNVLKGNFTAMPWTGNFAFLLVSSMTTSLPTHILSGTSYTSKIFLRDKNTAMLAGNAPITKPVRREVFVVLEGYMSSDQMALIWWGDAVLMFPNSPVY